MYFGYHQSKTWSELEKIGTSEFKVVKLMIPLTLPYWL